MRVRILPYGPSNSAVNLARNIPSAMLLRLEGSRFVQTPEDVVINWGSSRASLPFTPTLNPINNVNKAANKFVAFTYMRSGGVNVPPFTQDKEEAKTYFDSATSLVVERHQLRGHSGQGIEIRTSPDDLTDAPLYVKYIPKRDEYRVHVFQGTVIDVQMKRRRLETSDDEVNWKVRNLDGGFIFARDGVTLPEEAKEQAILAVNSLGLDFGAVDLIYNRQQNKYYVLEVNTACGLEGTTLETYVNTFKQFINGEEITPWTPVGTEATPEEVSMTTSRAPAPVPPVPPSNEDQPQVVPPTPVDMGRVWGENPPSTDRGQASPTLSGEQSQATGYAPFTPEAVRTMSQSLLENLMIHHVTRAEIINTELEFRRRNTERLEGGTDASF